MTMFSCMFKGFYSFRRIARELCIISLWLPVFSYNKLWSILNIYLAQNIVWQFGRKLTTWLTVTSPDRVVQAESYNQYCHDLTTQSIDLNIPSQQVWKHNWYIHGACNILQSPCGIRYFLSCQVRHSQDQGPINWCALIQEIWTAI